MKPAEITPEDFDAWLEQPITKLFMAAHARLAEMAHDRWIGDAWSHEFRDAAGREQLQIRLVEAKTKVKCFTDIANPNLTDILAVNGLLPEALEGQS